MNMNKFSCPNETMDVERDKSNYFYVLFLELKLDSVEDWVRGRTLRLGEGRMRERRAGYL